MDATHSIRGKGHLKPVVTVHPPSTNGGLGRSLGRWLRPGTPAAPASACLPLLPSGPDGVHKLASRGTRPSTPRAEGCSGPSGPRAGIRPRWSGLRVQGTASSPPSTVTVLEYTGIRGFALTGIL